MRPPGLYRLKPELQAMLDPVVRALVARGVSADALTLAAVPVAAVGGASLALVEVAPWLALVVPVAVALRLALNLLDGQVARRTGSEHPMGAVLNELGDRVADVLFVGGLAFVPAVGPWLGLAAVIAALLASTAGVTASAVGVSRQYGGMMSKPGRMIVLAVAAPLAAIATVTWPLVLAAWIILVGSLVTLVQRLVATRDAITAQADDAR